MIRSPRLWLISPFFPPMIGGPAIILDNLLSSYPGVVTASAGYPVDARVDPAFAAPCPTRYLPAPKQRALRRIYDHLLAYAPDVVYRYLWWQARRNRPDAIMAASPGGRFFVAAFRIAQALDIPFYPYTIDLWQEDHQVGDSWRKRTLADRWEHKILTHSTRVLSMTEFQKEHYEAKHGIHCELLPHAVAERDLATAPAGLRAASQERRTVLFAGALSQVMNLDALRTLARASELLPDNVDLVFCTNTETSLDSLADRGIRSARLRVTTASRAGARELESTANVLIAPLSHKSGSVDQIRTALSTKVLGYLVSGRPTLVFGPAQSYEAHSARQHGWGLVVDHDDPRALAAGIVTLLDDEEAAGRIVAGALAEARRRDARVHAQRLYDWVSADTTNGSRAT